MASKVIINGEVIDLERTPPYRPDPPPPEVLAEVARNAEQAREAAARWPRSVEAAVADLLTILKEDTKRQLCKLSKDNLSGTHFGLGLFIRNQYGLRGGNVELRRSCVHWSGRSSPEAWDPDICSGVIVRALWQELQSPRR